MAVVVAIDAGTTGIRSSAIDHDGQIVAYSYREFTQHFPQPGWVEHDATEIWETALATMAELAAQLSEPVATIGITNQRETVVAWDKSTGSPLHNAIVWQDRRTAAHCDELRDQGHLALVRGTTGLVLDPYFSGTKAGWLLRHGGVDQGPDLALGTIDSWILWNLTGGATFATEPSNASRTMLYDLDSMAWSEAMCDLLGVPIGALAEVRPTSGRFGQTTLDCPLGAGIPISGMAGDQQAALFGQACFAQGDLKNTYGTGSFVVMNAGDSRPEPVDGLLTSVSWQLGDGTVSYCLEGAIFVTGAAVQWLRDGLGIIDNAADLEPLAMQCEDTGGVMFVPALTGLGSPWWDPYARGTIVGLTRGTGRPEIARAVIEAIVHQTCDVVEAMQSASGVKPQVMRVDGGASVMDLMLQAQADHLGVPVARPKIQQTTAMGAGFLAGLAEQVWDSVDDIADRWSLDAEFVPADGFDGSAERARWGRAVERSQGWASDQD